jgi:type IX secretion system PorP/SprF family membrane protein
MKKKYLFVSILLVLLTICKIKSQDMTNYNLYLQNPVLYNPAYVLNAYKGSIFVNTRLQWTGFKGAPRINTFGINGAITKNMGLGLSIFNYKQGLTSNTNINIGYAYKIKLSENHFIKLGFAPGVLIDRFLVNDVENSDMTDEMILNNDYNKTSFAFRAGLDYLYKELEIQIIMPQLYERNKISTYTLGMLSYCINLNPVWKLKPMITVRGVSTSPTQVDINLSGVFKNTVWALAGYRSNLSTVFGGGIIFKDFELGYIYQLEANYISAAARSTHEIQLIYHFGDVKANNKKGKTVITKTSPLPVEQPKVITPKPLPPEQPKVVEKVPPQVEQPKVETPIEPTPAVEQPENDKPESFEWGNVLFKTDSYKLSDSAISILNKLVHIMQEYTDLKVQISGHTDNAATPEYNIKLSNNRVKSCVNYLVSKGIDVKRITKTEWYGLTKPAVPNNSIENMSKNRRVDFKFIE